MTDVVVSAFRNRHDTQPRRKALPWERLALDLSKHVTRSDKDGPLWSPCEWVSGTFRVQDQLEKGNLLNVSCFVADIDDGTPPDALKALWGNRAYVLYSSFTSTTTAPRWRVVFPLAVPIPANEWKEIWARCSHWLLHDHNDRSAKDPSRMYYTPSCPPERLGEAFTAIQDGEWLDARDLPPLPVAVTPAKPTYSAGSGEGRPGDDYNAATTHEQIAQLLQAHGWRRGADRGDAIDMIRPGKPSDIRSGTIGHVAPGVFYCFTDSAPPFAPGHGYDAFMVYTLLECGGDYSEAARQLSQQGYGWADIEIIPDGVRKPAPPPNGTPNGTTDGTPAKTLTPLTEYGNAERLIRRHGEDLRYCSALGWHVWDGRCWRLDESGEVERRAKDTIRKIKCEVKGADDARAKAVVKWATASESANRVSATIRLAQSEPGIHIPADQLDANPMVLNCQNGTLELLTGKLRPHDRADLLTRHLPYSYEPSATCPTWDAFLKRILPEDLIAYLQRAAGYTLTGLVTEQCLWYLWGSGSNGKSTLVVMLQRMLGEYATKMQSSVIVVKKGMMVNDELATLQGKRLAVINELGKHEQLAENIVKQITDTDVIRARLLYKNSFQFPQTHKIWIAANPKLYIADTGNGIMRRIKLVPFTVQIPEREKDLHLLDKLTAELPGILNWALRGLTQYLAFGIQEPAVVREAVETYAEENDIWGAFLADCCVVEPAKRVQAAQLYAAYCQWATARNERVKSLTIFGKELRDGKGFEVKKSNGNMYYHGLILKEGRMEG